MIPLKSLLNIEDSVKKHISINGDNRKKRNMNDDKLRFMYFLK